MIANKIFNYIEYNIHNNTEFNNKIINNEIIINTIIIWKDFLDYLIYGSEYIISEISQIKHCLFISYLFNKNDYIISPFTLNSNNILIIEYSSFINDNIKKFYLFNNNNSHHTIKINNSRFNNTFICRELIRGEYVFENCFFLNNQTEYLFEYIIIDDDMIGDDYIITIKLINVYIDIPMKLFNKIINTHNKKCIINISYINTQF